MKVDKQNVMSKRLTKKGRANNSVVEITYHGTLSVTFTVNFFSIVKVSSLLTRISPFDDYCTVVMLLTSNL